jgi:hypothetical protein
VTNINEPRPDLPRPREPQITPDDQGEGLAKFFKEIDEEQGGDEAEPPL